MQPTQSAPGPDRSTPAMPEKLTAPLRNHAGQRPELPAGRDPHRRKPDRALRRRFIWDALAAAWPRRAVWLVLIIAVMAIAACASSPEEGAQPTATLAATATPQETPTATLTPSAAPEETPTPSPAPAQTAETSATPEPPANSAETPPQPELAEAEPAATDPDPAPASPEVAPAVVISATLDLTNPYFEKNPPPVPLYRGPGKSTSNIYLPTGVELQPDQVVRLIGRAQGSSWVLVETADGGSGWAMGGHLFGVPSAELKALPLVEAPEPTTVERINMITFSNFTPEEEQFVRSELLKLEEGDKTGEIQVALTLEEFENAPPISASSRQALLAVPALRDLPAELHSASTWEIFRWHWQNQFGMPVEYVFKGVVAKNGRSLDHAQYEIKNGVVVDPLTMEQMPDVTVIVPPLMDTLLAATYPELYADGTTIASTRNTGNPSAAYWKPQSSDGKYKGFVYLSPDLISQARFGNHDDLQIFRAALAKELFSLTLSQQLAEISSTSTASGGQGLIINHAQLDRTLMIEEMSHFGVSLFVASNGFSYQSVIDFYYQEAFSLKVIGRD
jgi:hypothetical protein